MAWQTSAEAAKSGAPFLAADKPLAEARTLWSQAFDALTRVAALEGGVAAYNWGIGNVQRKGLANAPRETRDYVMAITGVKIA
jgi:hypothetical protein